MKRTIPLILVIAFILSGCARGEIKEETDTNTTSPIITESEEEVFIGSWLSFMELSVTAERDTEEKYSEYIDNILNNMKEVGVTDAFVQVRPFADAFYDSEFFPSSSYIAGTQGEEIPFDVLSLVTERAKKKEINIHAWINPYRVSSKGDINSICEDNLAFQWYEEGKTDHVVLTKKGIYFNPSSEKVRKLIADGARELMENYDIKGIHIDDYFYFEGCGDFDSEQYSEYVSGGGELDLSSWRRENINTLLSSLYITVKSYGEDKIFSVSPSGKISKCYNEDYADVYLWCSEEGYCDMIIPQIYFGFENESLPFESCLSEWVSLCESKSTKLVIGLALYKSGQEDTFALSGKKEWTENTDIISRQVELLMEKSCDGFALYSGSYINFSEKFLSEELNNLKSVL